MDIIWHALAAELESVWGEPEHLVRVTLRLIVAVLLAAVIGWNREVEHKTAGLRTHMLVALGSALLVVSALESMDAGDTSRVIQGVAAGVGFVGAGAVLKLESDHRVRGLTTAASIWLAAAVGVAAGMGRLGAAIVGAGSAWFVLVVVEKLKHVTDLQRVRREKVPGPEIIVPGHNSSDS